MWGEVLRNHMESGKQSLVCEKERKKDRKGRRGEERKEERKRKRRRRRRRKRTGPEELPVAQLAMQNLSGTG